MASLDVTSLFTNVPTRKVMTLLREHLASNVNLDLPIPNRDFLDLTELCVQHNIFSFEGEFYQQKFGMAMGSPISAVLANLYLEFLERGPFDRILPNTVTWLRYVDDVLIIAPRRLDLHQLKDDLNTVEQSIQFTLEEELDDQMPFLDALLIKQDHRLQFKVHRKPTNKDDLPLFLPPRLKDYAWGGYWVFLEGIQDL